MKNYISYFYNMNIDDISFTNQKYILNSNGIKYILEKCKNIEFEAYYMALEKQLGKSGSFLKPIANKNNRIITTIENQPYLLLRVGNIPNNRIRISNLSHVLYIENIEALKHLVHFPWHQFWKQKLDYIEEWYTLKKEKYKELFPWINYFIGLGENALAYIKSVELEEKSEVCDRLSIQHYRVAPNMQNYDYYDPSNIILDHPSRDIAEYIKSSISSGSFNADDLENYLDGRVTSNYWVKMLYGRLLFPSHFFDYIETTMMRDENAELISSIAEKMALDTEKALKNINVLLSDKFHVQTIKWIKKT